MVVTMVTPLATSLIVAQGRVQVVIMVNPLIIGPMIGQGPTQVVAQVPVPGPKLMDHPLGHPLGMMPRVFAGVTPPMSGTVIAVVGLVTLLPTAFMTCLRLSRIGS